MSTAFDEVPDDLQLALNQGRVLSAVKIAVELFNEAAGINKNRIRTLIRSLAENPEINAVWDEVTAAEVAKTIDNQVNMRDENHFIGKAFFPVFSDQESRLVLLEALDVLSPEIVQFKIQEESKGAFLTQIMGLWQFLNKRITKPETGSANDVTVLNWGISYRTHSNPFSEGIFAGDKMPELTGRSLHFASIVATVSLITGRYINPEFVFTGTLNVNGKSEKIGHLIEKSELVKAERGTSVKIVIPDINSFPKPERDYIENNRNIFKPVKNLEELIEAAFEIPADEVLTIQDEKRYEIGSTRLIAENLGVRQLTLYHRFDDYKFSHAVHNFNVVRCKVFEPIGLENKSVYNVYPLQQINFLPNPRNGLETLVVINFRTSISLTANLVSNNPQSRDIYAIRMGPKSDEYQIFAHPQGKSREYVGKYFNQADLELSGNYGSQSNQGY